MADLPGSEPTKPTEPDIDASGGTRDFEWCETLPTDEVLKGLAVELYLADGDRLFIVADEADAAKVGEPRGIVYTAAEARGIVQIDDPSLVTEVHRWKREFNATLRGCRKNGGGR